MIHEVRRCEHDCCFCGAPINVLDADGMVQEDAERLCMKCGGLHLVFAEDGDEDGTAIPYLYAVHCGHHIAADEPCSKCDPEAIEPERLLQ